MTVRVDRPEVPLCHRCRPLTLALNPFSGEMLRAGRCALAQPAEPTMAG